MLKNHIKCNISTYGSGMELISEYAKIKFDIIFLDMEMPELNGIETGLLIRGISNESIIIFITSHKEYAYESYKVKAKDYLLKPLSYHELENVLLHILKEKSKPKKFLDLKDVDGVMHHIPVNEITHILRKKEDRKIHIYCLDKKDIKVVQTIENLEKLLVNNESIVKSSKSCLINMDNVRAIKKNIIYFSNEATEQASRRCLTDLTNMFKLKKEVTFDELANNRNNS
jgi:DNA-binding LytR/AlgR family response regulator